MNFFSLLCRETLADACVICTKTSKKPVESDSVSFDIKENPTDINKPINLLFFVKTGFKNTVFIKCFLSSIFNINSGIRFTTILYSVSLFLLYSKRISFTSSISFGFFSKYSQKLLT